MTDQQTSRTNITEAQDGPTTFKPNAPFGSWTVLSADDIDGVRWFFHVPTAALAAEPRSDAVTAPDEPSTDWRWLVDDLEAKVRRLGEINDELDAAVRDALEMDELRVIVALARASDVGYEAAIKDGVLDVPRLARAIATVRAESIDEDEARKIAAAYAAETQPNQGSASPEQGRGDE